MIPANEALNRQRELHNGQIKELERLLDNAIEKAHDPSRVSVTVSYYMNVAVEQAIRELYERGGWHVKAERHSDQRDGDCTAVTLVPKSEHAGPALRV